MFDIKPDDYIFASPEFQKDRLLFDVLWYARYGAELLKSDCKSFVICRTNDSFPAVVWTDSAISGKDFDTLAYYLKLSFRGKTPYFMVREPHAKRITEIFRPLQKAEEKGLVAYVAEKAPPKAMVAGGGENAEKLRNPGGGDIPVLTDFVKGFSREIFGNDPGEEETKALVEKRLNAPYSYLYEAGGIPVGMIVAGRKSDGYNRIQSVYIAPGHRGKGYGQRMTARMCEKIFAEGHKPNLFADAANPVSNSVYRKVGFREAGRLAEIKMDGVQ